MSIFQVDDMTCGQCASKIRTALASADPQARIAVDIWSRRVDVMSFRVADVQLKEAIVRAEYTPVLLQPAVRSTVDPRQAGAAGDPQAGRHC